MMDCRGEAGHPWRARADRQGAEEAKEEGGEEGEGGPDEDPWQGKCKAQIELYPEADTRWPTLKMI